MSWVQDRGAASYIWVVLEHHTTSYRSVVFLSFLVPAPHTHCHLLQAAGSTPLMLKQS